MNNSELITRKLPSFLFLFFLLPDAWAAGLVDNFVAEILLEKE